MADRAIPGIDPQAAPSGPGCADCLAGDGPGWWFHLRRCAACGRVGCCDSSPSQHATSHFRTAGHPFITSYEPGEEWFYNNETEQFYDGPQLAPPTPPTSPFPARPEQYPRTGSSGCTEREPASAGRMPRNRERSSPACQQ